MRVVKSTLVCTLGLLGALAGPAAHATGANVQWTVTVGAPVLTLPVPALRLPVPRPVVVMPAPHVPPAVVVHDSGRYRDYREPTRWDADGDGIPNRHDRVYNPVWDRNGNGVPDRREYRDHRPYGDRDHDGIPNRYDRRDDRYDRYDGHGRDARDPRHGGRGEVPDHRRQPQ